MPSPRSNYIDFRLPLFIVPGMPRAGTTFLYHNLQKHPEIFLPFRKEIDYFNDIYHYRGLKWYNSLFKEIKEKQMAGDLSPSCWFSENSIDYIKEYSPNTKVILSIRNPAEFAVSLYAQKLSSNYDLPDSFEGFIKDGYNLRLTQEGKSIRFSFDDRNYINTIESYRNAFGKNLLIYDFQLFREDNFTIMKSIESFLGLKSWFTSTNYDNLRINESYRRNIKFLNYLTTQEWLRNAVEKYIPRLSAMRIRSYIDKISVRTSPAENTLNKHKRASIAIAKKYLPESCKFYSDLFEKRNIFLGDGTLLNG